MCDRGAVRGGAVIQLHLGRPVEAVFRVRDPEVVLIRPAGHDELPRAVECAGNGGASFGGTLIQLLLGLEMRPLRLTHPGAI